LELAVAAPFIALITFSIHQSLPVTRVEKSRVTRASLEIEQLRGALGQFERRMGRPPTDAEGLEALVGASLLPEPPRDPWGKPYRYRQPAQGGGAYELYSSGRDGAPDTKDDIR
jgi:general secretion pathway protein G